MQVVIKPYDTLTLIFYDAHSHNHITITICLLCSQENLYDMPTIIFYDENNDNHVTPKICLLHSQDNLHDMLCISPSVKYLSDRKTDSDHLTFAMLANPLASRLCSQAFCNNVISRSVKYLSERKTACPMDPIDPSDHLIFAMLANPLASRLYYLALCNYVIYSSLIPFMFNRFRQFTIGKIFVQP